jgi:hypothetical protein
MVSRISLSMAKRLASRNIASNHYFRKMSIFYKQELCPTKGYREGTSMLIGKVPVIFKSSVRIQGGGHDEFVLILHE